MTPGVEKVQIVESVMVWVAENVSFLPRRLISLFMAKLAMKRTDLLTI